MRTTCSVECRPNAKIPQPNLAGGGRRILGQREISRSLSLVHCFSLRWSWHAQRTLGSFDSGHLPAAIPSPDPRLPPLMRPFGADHVDDPHGLDLKPGEAVADLQMPPSLSAMLATNARPTKSKGRENRTPIH